jgi:hypothetical protein
MVFGGSAPGGACVVHQDVHLAHASQGLVGQPADFLFLAAVRGNPACVDARVLQLGRGFFQVGGLARSQHDPRAGLTQCVGHLKTQSTGAAGDECGLALEVEQLRNGACHASFSLWVVQPSIVRSPPGFVCPGSDMPPGH